MKHKQQIEAVKRMQFEAWKEKYTEDILRNQLSVTVLILGDKFGFGRQRMTQFLEHLANYTLSYRECNKNGLDTTYETIEETLKEDYKLDLDNTIINIMKKEEEEQKEKSCYKNDYTNETT